MFIIFHFRFTLREHQRSNITPPSWPRAAAAWTGQSKYQVLVQETTDRRRFTSRLQRSCTRRPPKKMLICFFRGAPPFGFRRERGDVIRTQAALGHTFSALRFFWLAGHRQRHNVDGFVQVDSSSVCELLSVPDGGRPGLRSAQDVDRRWEQQQRGLHGGSGVAGSGAATWTKLCGAFEAGNGDRHASRGKHAHVDPVLFSQQHAQCSTVSRVLLGRI